MRRLSIAAPTQVVGRVMWLSTLPASTRSSVIAISLLVWFVGANSICGVPRVDRLWFISRQP